MAVPDNLPNFSRKKEFHMKYSKFTALLVVGVMVFMTVQPAFSWSGEQYVKDKTGTYVKAVEVVADAYEVYETGRKLYNAKDNDERLDIAVDAAIGAGKGLVKKGVKATADAAIAGSATSTAVAIAGAAGMTAKTGTAIAALSGCAATNATLCAIGTPVVSALGAVGVTVGAPAVVGGAIVAGTAAAVCYGVHCLIDWIW